MEFETEWLKIQPEFKKKELVWGREKKLMRWV